MTIVQVCGCRLISQDIVPEADTGDVEPFVSNQKAEFFGVYLSLPDGRYDHLEDHDTREDALEAAHTAITQGSADELDDRTFDEAPK